MKKFRISPGTLFTFLGLYLFILAIVVAGCLALHLKTIFLIYCLIPPTIIYLPVLLLFFNHLFYFQNKILQFDSVNNIYYLNYVKFKKDAIVKITRVNSYFSRFTFLPILEWKIELKHFDSAVVISSLIISERSFSTLFSGITPATEKKMFNFVHKSDMMTSTHDLPYLQAGNR